MKEVPVIRCQSAVRFAPLREQTASNTQETIGDETPQCVTQQHIGMRAHDLSTAAENMTQGEELNENYESK